MDTSLVAHLQDKMRMKEIAKQRMARLHGKAASLGLSIMSQTRVYPNGTHVTTYSLLDKAAGEPMTGPNGEVASLTQDELEAVLEGKREAPSYQRVVEEAASRDYMLSEHDG